MIFDTIYLEPHSNSSSAKFLIATEAFVADVPSKSVFNDGKQFDFMVEWECNI